MALLNGVTSDATREQLGIKGASIAASTAPASDVDVESFIREYYQAWGGTDLDRIMSYYSEDIVLQIPGLLMEGKDAVRDQFAVPFTTAFPGNRHIVKGMIFGQGVVNVEFIFEAQHKGPFAGHAATGARVKLPGCGVYQYDWAKRQITAGRIYFDVETLLQTITDSLLGDRKKAEEALRTNERNLSLITNVIPTFIHVLRCDGSVLYANQAVLGYTGLTLEEVRKEDYRVRVFHPEDVERLREGRAVALTRPVPFENEQRVLGKDGKYRWFLIRYNPLLDAQGKIDRWYVAAFDIDDRKQTEWLRAAEMRTLQMISEGASLSDILNHLCSSMDLYVSPSMTTILLMDQDGKRLWHIAGSRVPREWVPIISPLPVALEAGLCGTAAFLKTRIIVPDVAAGPNWPDRLRPIAIRNGIRAGWSEPILSKDSQVLGTFALYSPEARIPTDADLALIEGAGRIALIAIERQRSQEALRDALEQIQKSESKLRQVIDTIPALAWCNLPDGSSEYINKGWYEYTGLSREEAQGLGWQAAFHPEDLPPLTEKWQKMLVSGESGEGEARLRRHDGVYRWFLIRAQPFRDDSGKIVRWYGTNTDIHDRKKAEEALQVSERNLAAIVNTIPTAAWTARPDGYCDFLNQVWLDYAGMIAEKAQGWGWAEAIHPDDREKLVEEWQSCLASGAPVDTEARIRRFDGSYRWFLIRANPLRDESGNILKWYGTCIDIDDRKRAEEALRASELDARSLLDNMPGFLARLSPDGTAEIVNRPLLQYFGRTVEEIRKWRTSDIVHPDDFAPTGEVMGDAVSTGQPCDFECRLRRFDGVYRWFQSRWVPVRDVERRILHWNALITDIDDRKNAEDALVRHAGVRGDVSAAFSKPTHLREILRRCTEAIVRHLDAAFARIWMLSKDESMLELQASAGMYTRLDGSYSRIPFGDQKVGLIAREKKAHFTNDVMNDPRVNDKGWARLNGMVAFAGYPLVVEDRLIGVVALFARRPLSESILDTLASAADTIAQGIERKRAEEELRASEAFLAEGQRLSHTGSWGWNASTGKVTWSQEHFRVLRLDPQKSHPSLDVFWERVHPDDRVGLQRTFESAIRDKRDFEQEFRIVTPDGSLRHLHGVGHAIFDQANELVEFIGSTMDITERRRAEAALQETRAELERVSRITTMGELAASIAHEVNQPLAGVVTSANAGLNWLATNPPNLAKTREALERILRDGTRGGEVLARIRSLLRRTPPVKTLVGMNQTVRDVLALAAGELRQHSIELSWELASPLPAVRGDNIQLQQVLLNLIKNAIDAMAGSASGQRTLRIQSRLGELDGNPAVVVEVSDTGVGFSNAETTRLFEAFYTTKPQGMGIGLWISRSIVENHHGRLRASPNDGPGATFVIMLPKAGEEEA